MWIGGLFNAMARLARALETTAEMVERLNHDAASRMGSANDVPALPDVNGHERPVPDTNGKRKAIVR